MKRQANKQPEAKAQAIVVTRRQLKEAAGTDHPVEAAVPTGARPLPISHVADDCPELIARSKLVDGHWLWVTLDDGEVLQ